MKTNLILPGMILIAFSTCAQTKNTGKYITFNERLNNARLFTEGGNSRFVVYYLDNKVKLAGKEYYVKTKRYPQGNIDTGYYREDNNNYYHFDPKINKESVVLPKNVMLGQNWFEADSSWSYEVVGTTGKLETSVGTYKGLIVIRCTQLTGRDKDKSREYHLYYAKGLGLVGAVNNGKLINYLEKKKVAAAI